MSEQRPNLFDPSAVLAGPLGFWRLWFDVAQSMQKNWMQMLQGGIANKGAGLPESLTQMFQAPLQGFSHAPGFAMWQNMMKQNLERTPLAPLVDVSVWLPKAAEVAPPALARDVAPVVARAVPAKPVVAKAAPLVAVKVAAKPEKKAAAKPAAKVATKSAAKPKAKAAAKPVATIAKQKDVQPAKDAAATGTPASALAAVLQAAAKASRQAVTDRKAGKQPARKAAKK